MDAKRDASTTLPMQIREAEVVSNTVDAESRTVEVVWTTGARVARHSYFDGPYQEELDTDPKAVRMKRLNSGAPVLDSHRSWGLDGVIGVVEKGSATIKPGEGRAKVRFAKDDDKADAIWRKVQQGIITAVSVGYRIHKLVETREKDGTRVLRATDWEPYEISFVAVGADADAGIRSDHIPENACVIERDSDMPNTNGGGSNAGATDAQRAAEQEAAVTAARSEGHTAGVTEGEKTGRGAREAEILAIMDTCSLAGRTLADAAKYVRDGKTPDQVRSELVAARDAQAGAEADTRSQHGGDNAGDFKRGMAADMMRARYGAAQ